MAAETFLGLEVGLWLDAVQPARMTVFALSLRADEQKTARGQLADPFGGDYWKGMPLIRTVHGCKKRPLYLNLAYVQLDFRPSVQVRGEGELR